MTPEEHNRYLALTHLVYGALNLLLICVGIIFMLGRGALEFDRGERIIMLVGIAIVSFINLAFTIPSLVAAWALFKRKPWAKTAAIVAAALATMFFPLGPVVTGYTFWFLFNAPGKALYDKPQPALPSATANWASQPATERAKAGMPDWR